VCFHDPEERALLQRAKGWVSTVRRYRFFVVAYGERAVRRVETVMTETMGAWPIGEVAIRLNRKAGGEVKDEGVHARDARLREQLQAPCAVAAEDQGGKRQRRVEDGLQKDLQL
jgi:hypothetical protein